jgi:pilus assembly protein CpaF
METNVVLMEDLYEFVRTGLSPTGKVLGEFRSTGIRSKYAEKMFAAGFSPSTVQFGKA